MSDPSISQSMYSEHRDIVNPLAAGKASEVKKNYQYSEESSYVGSEDYDF